jgi:hypothetical protein
MAITSGESDGIAVADFCAVSKGAAMLIRIEPSYAGRTPCFALKRIPREEELAAAGSVDADPSSVIRMLLSFTEIAHSLRTSKGHGL